MKISKRFWNRFFWTVFLLINTAAGIFLGSRLITGGKKQDNLIARMMRESSFPLQVIPSRPEYRIGDPISFLVRSEYGGNLYIIDIRNPEAPESWTLLFPNEYTKEPRISSYMEKRIPESDGYSFVAREPIGMHLVLTVVSRTEADFASDLPAALEKVLAEKKFAARGIGIEIKNPD